MSVDKSVERHLDEAQKFRGYSDRKMSAGGNETFHKEEDAALWAFVVGLNDLSINGDDILDTALALVSWHKDTKNETRWYA